jgi:hypothetical protein
LNLLTNPKERMGSYARHKSKKLLIEKIGAKRKIIINIP